MKKFRCIYDGDSFIDGIECETFDEAKDIAESILFEWAGSCESDEDHDIMVNTCMTWVEEFDEDFGEWYDIWYPDNDFLESIGFVERMVKS